MSFWKSGLLPQFLPVQLVPYRYVDGSFHKSAQRFLPTVKPFISHRLDLPSRLQLLLVYFILAYSDVHILHGAQHLPNKDRMPCVVRIQKSDIFPGHTVQPCVSGSAEPPCFPDESPEHEHLSNIRHRSSPTRPWSRRPQ